ncbi:MAG: hypothetical protein ABIH83_03745 [Candidatus Micrarchaeota archaeon]
MKTAYFALLLLLVSSFAFADIGPKPTMDFNIIFNTSEEVAIADAELIECEDEECTNAHTLEEMGPQYFECNQTNCNSMSYGYSEYHKIKINFSNGTTRESNIFYRPSSGYTYPLYITDSEILVGEKGTRIDVFNLDSSLPDDIDVLPNFGGLLAYSGLILLFVAGLFITLIIEITILLVYMVFTKFSRRMVLTAIGANVITLPAVWFLFPVLITDASYLVYAEVFAILFEAFVIFAFNSREISMLKALLLAIIMNLASFLLGSWLLTFL